LLWAKAVLSLIVKKNKEFADLLYDAIDNSRQFSAAKFWELAINSLKAKSANEVKQSYIKIYEFKPVLVKQLIGPENDNRPTLNNQQGLKLLLSVPCVAGGQIPNNYIRNERGFAIQAQFNFLLNANPTMWYSNKADKNIDRLGFSVLLDQP